MENTKPTFSLEEVIIDNGYPDPGHVEYVIVKTTKRRYSIFQKMFGDKKEKIFYLLHKPDDKEFNKIVQALHK